MCLATVHTWVLSESSRSIQWSMGRIGTTRVWPGASTAMGRKATTCSSRHTKRPGSSPSMMREKMVVTVAL